MPLFKRRQEPPRGRPREPRSPRFSGDGTHEYDAEQTRPREYRTHMHTHSHPPSFYDHQPSPDGDRPPRTLASSPGRQKSADFHRTRRDPALPKPRDRGQVKQSDRSPDRDRYHKVGHRRISKVDRLPDQRNLDDLEGVVPPNRRRPKSRMREPEQRSPYSDQRPRDPQRQRSPRPDKYNRDRPHRPLDSTRRQRGRDRRDERDRRDDRYPRRARSAERGRGDEEDVRFRRNISRERDRRSKSAPKSNSEAARPSRSATQPLKDVRAKAAKLDLPWQSIAAAALQAGATAAYKARRDPGPWLGAKGTKVATAAIGAAIMDSMSSGKKKQGTRK